MTHNLYKWKPNDKLVVKYYKFLNCMAELNRLTYCLENMLIPKSKKLIKEFMLLKRSSKIEDKLKCSKIKNEMVFCEQQINYVEKSIDKFKTTELDTNIIMNITSEWNNYIESATSFLVKHNINNIHVHDILTTNSLYRLANKNINDINIINNIFEVFEPNNKNFLCFNDSNNLFFYDNNDNIIDYQLNIDCNTFDLNDNVLMHFEETN